MGWKGVAVGWRVEVAWERVGEPGMEVSESSESLSMVGRELRWAVKAGESRQETVHRVLWDLMQAAFLWR